MDNHCLVEIHNAIGTFLKLNASACEERTCICLCLYCIMVVVQCAHEQCFIQLMMVFHPLVLCNLISSCMSPM
jgi:hypothetical protein